MYTRYIYFETGTLRDNVQTFVCFCLFPLFVEDNCMYGVDSTPAETATHAVEFFAFSATAVLLPFQMK